MRVEFGVGIEASGAAALTRGDGFARCTADPAIGGFRILRPQPLTRSGRRPARRRFSAGRMPATGFLSVLFIGGLALAVLAGPASCPCGHPEAAKLAKTDAGARLTSRLSYSRESIADLGARVRARASAPKTGQRGGTALPDLTTVAALDSEAPLSGTVRRYGTSPISTAAIPPVTEAPEARPFGVPQRLGLLPAEFESLSDTAPRLVKVAAATPADGGLMPMLPTVVIATPDELEVIDVETQAKPAAKTKHHRQHSYSTRRQDMRSTSDRLARRAAARRAPRWAQQMFANPWQSKAFSYLR